MELMQRRQSALCLMLAIAQRARVTDGGPYNLKAGQALIGDWKQLGYSSYKVYLKDRDYLMDMGWIGKKTTKKGTIRGTIVTITESSPFQVKMLPKNSDDLGQETAPFPDETTSPDWAHLGEEGRAHQNKKAGISPGISLSPNGADDTPCNRGSCEADSEPDFAERAHLRSHQTLVVGHINGHTKGTRTNNGTNVTKGSTHQKITIEGKLKRATEKAKRLFDGRKDNAESMAEYKAAQSEVERLETELSKFPQ